MRLRLRCAISQSASPYPSSRDVCGLPGLARHSDLRDRQLAGCHDTESIGRNPALPRKLRNPALPRKLVLALARPAHARPCEQQRQRRQAYGWLHPSASGSLAGRRQIAPVGQRSHHARLPPGCSFPCERVRRRGCSLRLGWVALGRDLENEWNEHLCTFPVRRIGRGEGLGEVLLLHGCGVVEVRTQDRNDDQADQVGHKCRPEHTGQEP